MNLYRFPCGCEWPILEDSNDPDVMPLLDFDIEKAPADCPATWALLGRGETKGVFQLESNLGRQWSKKLKPEHEEHISGLVALLRPGCLKAVDENGVSMTQHYCRRKNQEEPVEIYHPALEKILFPTYGVLVYQEQAMFIAMVVAGFNEMEADMLRKAIGKKLAAEMAKVKLMFIEGVKKAGVVTEQQGEEIFGWIEKAQRYSFNKSHAMGYGLTGYDTAYIKAHCPLAFFTGWLYHAKDEADPQQEIFELVNDAKLFDIVVGPPDLRNLQAHFSSDRKQITFGLSDIKGIGESQIEKLKKAVAEVEVQLGKKLWTWTWSEFLLFCSPKLSSNLVTNLIKVGALRWMDVSRTLMLAEFAAWETTTKTERSWVEKAERCPDLIATLKALSQPKYQKPKKKKDPEPKGPFGGCHNEKRRQSVLSQVALLEKPPTSMKDSPHWIAWVEEELLGTSITCCKIDSCDTSQVNVTCKEFLAGRTGFLLFGVEIQQVREVKTKKGKNPGSKMGFLTISDNSCALDDVVCFPDVWKEYSNLLIEGNTVIIQGERDEREKSNSLFVKKVWYAPNCA